MQQDVQKVLITSHVGLYEFQSSNAYFIVIMLILMMIKIKNCDDHNDDSDDSRAVFLFGGGVLPQASLVDGIRVLPLSGTITSATVKLYGVKQL